MTIFEANISPLLIEFFKTNLKNISSINAANNLLKEVSGINIFFNDEKELSELKNIIEEHVPVIEEPNRRAYGDFQTNEDLADNIAKYLYKEGVITRIYN